MKRRDLIKLLVKNGWWLEREGGKYEIYTNGSETESVPRHTEIKENLAKGIIKRQNLK